MSSRFYTSTCCGTCLLLRGLEDGEVATGVLYGSLLPITVVTGAWLLTTCVVIIGGTGYAYG